MADTLATKPKHRGMCTILVGGVLSMGGSIGFLISDAPGWAKWGLPIAWGLYFLREGATTFFRDLYEKRNNKRASDAIGRQD